MERQSYKSFITNKYGEITYRKIINYQNNYNNIYRLKQDIDFLTKCKRSDVIPIHCRMKKRRNTSPGTKKLIKTTERKLLNRSISRNYSKRWKLQQNRKNNDNFLEEKLSVKDYCDLLKLTEKRTNSKQTYIKEHLNNKYENLLRKKVIENRLITSDITIDEKEEHQQKTLLNYSDIAVPMEFVPLLSKGLDFKIATEKLPIMDMICAIEGVTKSFSSNAIANEFKHECKNILKKGRQKTDINVTEKMCTGLRTWLKQNEIVLIENDKGRDMSDKR